MAAAFLAAGSAAAQEDLSQRKGYAIYHAKCAPCHGDEGKGDGPAAKTMLPRPRVFADNSNYKFRSTANGELPLREDLYRVITQGIPGTAMPSFGDRISEKDRWDLVSFIESLSEDFADPDNQAGRKALPIGEPPPITDELIARGQKAYNDNKCYECHGKEGRGDWAGWNEKQDLWGDYIVPANLTRWHQLRGGADIKDLYRATLTGFNGTPMPNTEMPEEDRWALSAWLRSIQQPRKETQDQVVLAKRVEQVPVDAGDERWNEIPSQMFFLVGQVVEKPRLFWPSVTEVFVRAAYDEDELALLLQWDDRDQSPGTNLTEYPAKDDPITQIFVNTDHPDQLAVQFPDSRFNGTERPYFLWGDSGHKVNLWWWTSMGTIVERNAAGKQPVDQGEESQSLQGKATYNNGRYTLILRRSLTTSDPDDVQVEPGKFVPIAFNVWQGTRGEVGKRRAVSTWYLLMLAPPTPAKAYVAPFIWAGLTLALLLFIVTRVFGRATGIPRVYRLLFVLAAPLAIGSWVLEHTAPTLHGFFTATVAKAERAELDETKAMEFQGVRRRQEADLRAYRWVDKDRQTVKVPIEAAMDRVIEEAKRERQAGLAPAGGGQ